MAKQRETVTVTIYRTDGSQETIRGVDADRAYHYEQLPFTNPSIARVDVRF